MSQTKEVICDECKKKFIELFNGRICMSCYIKICERIYKTHLEYEEWAKEFRKKLKNE